MCVLEREREREREREHEEGRAELENRVIASSLENGLIVFTSTPLIVAIIRNTQNNQREKNKTKKLEAMRKICSKTKLS